VQCLQLRWYALFRIYDSWLPLLIGWDLVVLVFDDFILGTVPVGGAFASSQGNVRLWFRSPLLDLAEVVESILVVSSYWVCFSITLVRYVSPYPHGFQCSKNKHYLHTLWICFEVLVSEGVKLWVVIVIIITCSVYGIVTYCRDCMTSILQGGIVYAKCMQKISEISLPYYDNFFGIFGYPILYTGTQVKNPHTVNFLQLNAIKDNICSPSPHAA